MPRLEQLRRPKYQSRGAHLIHVGQHEEALAAYQQATQLVPDDTAAWYKLAVAWRTRGNDEEALAAIEHAHRLTARDPLVWRFKADMLYRLRRLDEALALCEQWLAQEPDDADMWNVLGMVCQAQRRYDDALVAYERSLYKQSWYALNSYAQLVIERREREREAKRARCAMALQRPLTYASSHRRSPWR